MVLSSIPLSTWILNGPSAFEEPWIGEANAALDKHGSSEELLQRFVSNFRAMLAKVQPETTGFEQLYKLTKTEPDLLGLDKVSDDVLLDRIYQLGLVAESILDRLEVLDRRIPELEGWRDRGMVWSHDAEELLQEFRRLRRLHKCNEAAVRRWSNQLCDEYERRHPDRAKLPFEPLDLGPTNSARLPPVL